MYKFTQGEWYVTDEDFDSVTTSIVTESVCYMNKSHPEFEPNAHLIAAAPDMYRALDILVNVEWGKQPVNLMKTIESILAKARGEDI